MVRDIEDGEVGKVAEIVLGKFGLVRFGTILAKPETELIDFAKPEPKPDPDRLKPFQTVPNHSKPIKN